MAENVRWLADYERGAKLILWAANPHITTPWSGCMGAHLRRMYGDGVVSIGLLCNRHSYGSGDEKTSPESAQYLAGPRSGSFEAILTEAGLEIAVLNLRFLPGGSVSRYFNAPPKTGSITSLLPWAYDAILFIESTTNARPVGAGAPGDADENMSALHSLDLEGYHDLWPRKGKSQSGQS